MKDFVQYLREHKIEPHIARIDGRMTPALDGRTSRIVSVAAYNLQRIAKMRSEGSAA